MPELRFSEFSGEWESSALIGLLDKVIDYRGIAPPKSPQGVTLITAKNIRQGHLDFNIQEFVATEDYDDWMTRGIPERGDILFTTEAPLGNVCMFPEKGVFALGQRTITLRTKKNINDGQFLFHLLQAPKSQAIIVKKSTGTTAKGIKSSEFKKLNFNVPAYKEQQKIATFLSTVDKKLGHLRRKNALLETYKRGIMQKIFPSTSSEQTRPELRFKQDNGADFPDWEEKRLGEISVFHDNQRVPLKEGDRKNKQGKYPYYGASGIIDYIDEYIFDGEYILLGEDGANIVSRSTRLAFLVSGKFWVNNHAHVIESKTLNKFLEEALERINYEKYNTGTAQPKLNAEICKKIPIGIPSLLEQQKIANFLSTLDKKLQAVQNQIDQTETFKKGLLQKMFV